MHDCPVCKVPLHGHEAVCPSCGTKQKARRSQSSLFGGDEVKKPPVNAMPFVVAALIFLALGAYLLKDSWIAQLMNRPPQQEDPMAKLTFLDARNLVESKITEGVTAVGGKTTFKWQRAGADVDKASEGPVEVAVEVNLKEAEQHKAIVDPVKDYFEKAQIKSLTMTDAKLHATWTYNLSTPAPAADSADSSASDSSSGAPAGSPSAPASAQ